jgi:hypothetical protein
MPIYLYKNNETGEIREVFQGMNDDHVYFGDGEEKEDWGRIWTKPNMTIDSQIDPFSSRQFVEKTGKECGTVGDLWDRSKELSEKRKEILGKDPIKEQYYEDYTKKRNGSQHPDFAPTSFENEGAKVPLDD